jgi:hypothetical protein
VARAMEPLRKSKPTESPLRFWTREGTLFHDFYCALQAETGHTVPLRSALDPRQARAFLPYLCIQEVISLDEVRLRHVGTIVVNRMGFDPTGRNIFEVMTPEQKQAGWEHLRKLLDQPCGSSLVVDEPYENKDIRCEVVSFPFADEDGVPRYVVSLCVETDTQDLAVRGDSARRIGDVLATQMIDIGAGI